MTASTKNSSSLGVGMNSVIFGAVDAVLYRPLPPGLEAAGRQIRRTAGPSTITIVGVVGDVRRAGRAARIEPGVYYPAAQTELYPVPLADFALRTTGDPRPMLPLLREAVLSIDRTQPIDATQLPHQRLGASRR